MNTGLERARPGQIGDVERIGARLADYLAATTAASTRDAYAADFARFVTWCEKYGASPLPAAPEVVAHYLADLADTPLRPFRCAHEGAARRPRACRGCRRAATYTPATITRRASAIAAAHTAAGLESPTRANVVREALKGIRRTKGTAPAAKTPLTVADLRAIVGEHLPAGVKGTRDRALLLVGMAGGFRRSELVGIDREHVEFVGEGVVITLPRSKTDQEGAGRKVAIPSGHKGTCPVRALTAWITAADIEEGPVFRPVNRHGQIGAGRLTGRGVALTVKHYAAARGKDARAYSGHSLRAGFATAAARAGAAERDIMRQTGHRSEAMVRRYIRDGSLFRDNAAGKLGL